MKLVFLGTSASTPTNERNLPATGLHLDNGEIVLFDTGEDVQRRFERVFKMNVPTTICISHLHGDHIIGLVGLLFNFHMGERKAPLTILGPRGLYEYLLSHMMIIGLKILYPLHLIEVLIPESDIFKNMTFEENPPLLSTINQSLKIRIYEFPFQNPPIYNESDSANGILLQTKTFHIRGTWVYHSVPTLGFRFEETERCGKFDPEKARKLGIPEGKMWGKMQKGQIITLKNGTSIDPKEKGIIGPNRPGLIITYTGDTGLCSQVVALAQNSDYLICEATFAQSETSLAIEKRHMSMNQAATLAKIAHVENLFLTHFSSRYKDPNIFLTEIQGIFSKTIFAYDLLEIELIRKDP